MPYHLSASTEMVETWSPRVHGVLRIIVGLFYLQHALSKLFGFPHVAVFDNLHLFSLIGLAGVIELIGSSLLIIGLFTRPVAFILSGEMAVAYFSTFVPRGFFPLTNGGELAALYCFIFFYFFVVGSGAFGLDRVLWPAEPRGAPSNRGA
jgi:putative oxidoreductase